MRGERKAYVIRGIHKAWLLDLSAVAIPFLRSHEELSVKDSNLYDNPEFLDRERGVGWEYMKRASAI